MNRGGVGARSLNIESPSQCGLLGDKPFRRGNRVNTEIVVPGAGNAHEALRHPHQTVKSLPQTDGNDRIVLAVTLARSTTGLCRCGS
jgi:hypothetical protein